MTERQALEHAIATLETQRETLGSAIVDTSIAVMRARLATISAARPVEQRKLVTILFADIVGWTGISEQLDPEDLRQIQHNFFDAVTPVIAGYGGAVEKYIGDAVLAVFGVPAAHEDDAKRAVLAALAIHQAVAALNRTAGKGAEGSPPTAHTRFPLHLRIGIHTGMVMATTGHEARDFLVTGDAVNLASRLQAAADPGSVLISRDTQRLVADEFALEPLPPFFVKGAAEPVVAYRVLGVNEPTAAPRTMAGRSAMMVGRQAELAVLHPAIERLNSGSGSVAVVIGDAGIGKSRLVEEAFRSTEAQTVDVIWGRCLSFGNAIPYHLWLELLRGSARIPADAPNDVVDARLRAWINQYCSIDCEEIYLALARLLALTHTTARDPGAGPIDSQTFKSGVFRAIETLVRSSTAQKPLAIICEDLQWADPSSVELLEHLAWIAGEIPLMLTCVLRPDASQPIWRLVGQLSATYQRQHVSLWLQPLSAAHSEQLVANLLGGELAVDAPPARGRSGRAHKLLWRILSRAEGNPFFLEEAIRALIQSDALTTDRVSGKLRLRADAESLSIPETVQAVLGARIDSLQAPARRALQVAAVIGRDFSHDVLALILPDESSLEDHLRTLREQDFVTELSSVAEQEYRFTHALVREVAYNGLLRSERRRYHRQVAEAFETLWPASDRNVEILAFHWQESGQPMRAAGYLLQSGDRARQIGSSVEAALHFQKAMDLVDGSEDPLAPIKPYLLHERLGDVYFENLSDQGQARIHYTAFLAAASEPLDRARGARKLASIDMLQGDLAEAQVYFERALDYLADLPADPEGNRVHCGLAYLFVSRGDMVQAGVHVRQCIRVARSIGDLRGLADAYRIRGIIADSQGRTRLAVAYARRCLKLYEQLVDLPQLAQACNNVAVGYRKLGYLEQAKHYLQTGIELAQRIGDIRDQALLLMSQAELLLDQGLADEAIEALLEALPLAQSSGAGTRVIPAHQILGDAYHQSDRLVEAQRHLETALTLCQETHHHRFQAALLLDLAHLAVSKGEEDRCLQLIELVEEAAGPAIPAPVAREILRVRGRLALRQEKWSYAVEALQASLNADARESVASRANAHYLLAMAYAGRLHEEDRANACRQLRFAGNAFRRLEASSRLADVKQLRRRLECARG